MNLLSTVLAADTTIDIANPAGVGSPTGFTIESIVQWAITAIIVVAGLIFFFMLIIGGLRWVLSGGDKAQTEAARGQITAALIGLVIIFSAWAIAQLVEAFFGISLFKLDVPSI